MLQGYLASEFFLERKEGKKLVAACMIPTQGEIGDQKMCTLWIEKEDNNKADILRPNIRHERPVAKKKYVGADEIPVESVNILFDL